MLNSAIKELETTRGEKIKSTTLKMPELHLSTGDEPSFVEGLPHPTKNIDPNFIANPMVFFKLTLDEIVGHFPKKSKVQDR